MAKPTSAQRQKQIERLQQKQLILETKIKILRDAYSANMEKLRELLIE